METQIFTPRMRVNGQWNRLRLHVTPEDYAKLATLGRKRTNKTVIMVDQSTGQRYKAKPASCGLDCYCDAIVTKIGKKEAR